MANTKKPLSVIVDSTNSVDYEIRAKQLESQIQVKLTGDTTGSATTDFSSDVSISTTIANKTVTEAKIADSAVTTGKINDKAVTLDKIADSARGGAVSDNDGVLATHSAVKSYVDSAIAGQGSYLGKQTVATINTWTAANLKNSDRVMCADSGTITLGNISVRAGEDLIFWKNGETAIWQSMDGEFKLKQTAKSDPTASGTTITAIDTISQDTNGEITATKKTIRSATTSQTGVVQLNDAINSTSTTQAATANAVKKAYDRAGTLIAALDVASVGGDGKYISTISETDGKISATATDMDTEPTANSKKAVTSRGIKTAIDDLNTSLGLQINEFASNLTAKLNGKTDLVEDATSGNFAGLDANGNLTDSGKKASDFKTIQTAKASPTASGNDISFIDTITQNTNGEITATKKTVRSASTSQTGVVQLSDAVNSTSTTLGATANAVKKAYDLASGKKDKQTAVSDPTAGTNKTLEYIATIEQDTNGVITPTKETIPTATSSQLGVVKLGSDTVQTVDMATPSATASRTYPIQKNSSGQMVVNVPWTNTTYTAATATPEMDGTGAVGSSAKYAREDHVHPSDNSKENQFDITYDLTNSALVFSKGFGTTQA